MRCLKLILIWLAAAIGLTGVGGGGAGEKEVGAVSSHHLGVMLTVTGVSLAKGEGAREARPASGRSAFWQQWKKPLVLRKDVLSSWSRKYPVPSLRNQCPTTGHWKRGMILSNRLVTRQIPSNWDGGPGGPGPLCRRGTASAARSLALRDRGPAPPGSEAHVDLLGELSLQVQDEGVEVFEVQVRVEGCLEVVFEVRGARRLARLLVLVLAVAARHVVVVRPGQKVPAARQEVPSAHAPVARVAVTRGALRAAPAAGPRHHFGAGERQVQRRLPFGPQVWGEVGRLRGPAGICGGRAGLVIGRLANRAPDWPGGRRDLLPHRDFTGRARTGCFGNRPSDGQVERQGL